MWFFPRSSATSSGGSPVDNLYLCGWVWRGLSERVSRCIFLSLSAVSLVLTPFTQHPKSPSVIRYALCDYRVLTYSMNNDRDGDYRNSSYDWGKIEAMWEGKVQIIGRKQRNFRYVYTNKRSGVEFSFTYHTNTHIKNKVLKFLLCITHTCI